MCKGLKLRKLLYRAGDTLQAIFYKSREHTFDAWVTGIEYNNGKMLIYDVNGREPTNELFMEDDVLKRFPSEICRTEDDKKALLAFMACQEALAYLYHVFKHVLEGVATSLKVEETELEPKNAKIPTIGFSDEEEYGARNSHMVLRVTLPNQAGQFAIDLSSAQYGFYEPVTSWDEYSQEWVHRIASYKAFEALQMIYHRQCIPGRGEFFKAWMQLVDSLGKKASNWLLFADKVWETKTLAISKLLSLPQRDYEEKMKGLLDHIVSVLRKEVKELRSKCQEQKIARSKERDKNARWECMFLKESSTDSSTEEASLGETIVWNKLD